MEGDDAMKKVIFKAPVLTQSGYGVHARQVARYLIEKAESKQIDLYFEPVRWGDTSWTLDGSMFDGLVKKVMKYTRPIVDQNNERMKFDVSIQLILPNEWTPSDAKFNVGITAGVETDKCNPAWIDNCNAMDLIIVPSTFTESTFRATGDVKTPLHVVPESYTPALTVPNSTPVDFGFSTPFNFLIVSQLTANHSGLDRKNIFAALKAVCETFKNDEEVGLVIKTNSGRGSKIDRLTTIDKFRQMLSAVRKDAFPKIHLVHGELSDSHMADLYRDPSIKAFVSPTRGEGYGLPILEAAVAGVPVIATDWSGHLDFMNKGKFIKIGYELQLIPDQKIDKNIWMRGSRWACPNENHLKTALKKFRQSSDIPKEWAMKLSETLKEEYSFERIRDMYDAVLSEHI